jgi:hypothetical protein
MKIIACNYIFTLIAQVDSKFFNGADNPANANVYVEMPNGEIKV